MDDTFQLTDYECYCDISFDEYGEYYKIYEIAFLFAERD